jgi:hypothetical protein
MESGTEHKTARCEDKNCQRYGEKLQYSKKYKSFVCPDSLVTNGEM